MPTRDEITSKLDRERAKLVDRMRALPAGDLTRPCTESEVDGAESWAAKDHLAHLAMIERAFQGMIRRSVEGTTNPVGFDLSKGRDEVIARVHKGNQDNIEEHKDDDLDMLLADLENARAETRVLLDSLSDEQLAQPLPGAPWNDGTIGGVIITNAHHEAMHWQWVEEGLAKT